MSDKNHCGSCKHLSVSEEFPAHNKLGLFRCSKAKDRALFVFINKVTDCEMHEKVKDLGERRKVLRLEKMVRHAKRTDENHAEVRDGLRAQGYEVYDFSAVGGGVGDLAVKISPTMSVWLEVKRDKKEKLTDKEVIFKMLWFDCYRVVTSVDEAVIAIEQTKAKFKDM